MSSTTTRAGTAAHSIFSRSVAERAALARTLFFEEGQCPSGLVSEAVVQSWMRCLRASADPRKSVVLEPISTSRIHAARERSQRLLKIAEEPLREMERAISGTSAHVLVTNNAGVVLYASPTRRNGRTSLRKGGPIGLNLTEAKSGTNAPGLVVATGEICTVTATEHYFESMHSLRCAAAPIRDATGALAAVLNVTTEGRPFEFDPVALVSLYATIIENALLEAQACEQLVLRFQTHPGLLNSPLAGLVGIDSDGQVAWVNSSAAGLLGCAAITVEHVDVNCHFGVDLPQLLALTRSGSAQEFRLTSGLGVWIEAAMNPERASTQRIRANAMSVPHQQTVEVLEKPDDTNRVAQSEELSITLREHSYQLIRQTLEAQRGNVSRTARLLGMSRSTLHRKLMELRAEK